MITPLFDNFTTQDVVNRAHLAALPPTVTQWKQPVVEPVEQIEVKALKFERLWKASAEVERLLAKHNTSNEKPKKEPQWHPTPLADAMLVKLRLRRVAWFEPKPAPAHLRDDGTVPLWSSKYRRTKCECGRATFLDADGWSLWWNSDAAVCPDCYASEMDRMPSKKDTEGNSLIRDNSGCGTLAIDSYRVALQKRH